MSCQTFVFLDYGYNQVMAKRIIFSCIAFISIFFAPWWVMGILLLVGYAIFDRFYEGLVIAFFFDLLYKPGSIWGIYFISFFISLGVSLITPFIKKIVRQK